MFGNWYSVLASKLLYSVWKLKLCAKGLTDSVQQDVSRNKRVHFQEMLPDVLQEDIGEPW